MERRPRDARRLVVEYAAVVSVLVMIATISGFFGGVWWLLDLFSHFRMQYAALALLCVVATMVRPGWVTALTAAPLLVNAACIAPLYLGAPGRADARVTPLVVTSFNVHTENREKAAVVTLLERSGADVIFVYEVDRAWLEALETMTPPYRIVDSRPESDNFGIAALARVPVADHRVMVMSDALVPSIEVTIEWEGREVVLLGTHALPPVNAAYAAARDQQLANVGAWSERERRPHAVFGDFNATPWSAPFRALVEGTLVDSERGWAPSWPAGQGALGLLAVPIDHALVSKELIPLSRTIGDSAGSDHRALTVRLGFY